MSTNKSEHTEMKILFQLKNEYKKEERKKNEQSAFTLYTLLNYENESQFDCFSD